MPVEFPAGRGAGSNPESRFASTRITVDADAQFGPEDDERPDVRTQFFWDDTKSILASNDSPDLGFAFSVNPYRGCEHGCAYCYARPTHEFLGWSAGLDFESRILVKRYAAELLRSALMAPRWEPQVIAFSGVTDSYQPVERRLKITRGCLEVCADFRNPVGIVTKNHLVTRDADVLADLARHGAAAVYVSITTLDPDLAKKLEPRASPPSRRLAAIAELHAAGVPAGVSVAPVIPGLNEHEIPAILRAAAEAGAQFATYTVLRLPYGVKDIFDEWLRNHFPGHREKVLGRVRELRGGKLNESDFGKRMRGEGAFAEQIRQLFRVARERYGLPQRPASLSAADFRRPGVPEQMELI